MNPGKFDLNMYRGDTYSWRFILWKNAAKTDPIDLTDATIDMEIKDKPSSPSPSLSMPCVIVLPNIVEISMTPLMYNGCPSKGVWDMQITFPDGQVHTPIGGAISITQDITKSSQITLRKGAKV
jgi:hypothetical protein